MWVSVPTMVANIEAAHQPIRTAENGPSIWQPQKRRDATLTFSAHSSPPYTQKPKHTHFLSLPTHSHKITSNDHTLTDFLKMRDILFFIIHRHGHFYLFYVALLLTQIVSSDDRIGPLCCLCFWLVFRAKLIVHRVKLI